MGSGTVIERSSAANARLLKEAVRPLSGSPDDFDPLLEMIGNARYVLIGEASHGTHEFYRVRAEIESPAILRQPAGMTKARGRLWRLRGSSVLSA